MWKFLSVHWELSNSTLTETDDLPMATSFSKKINKTKQFHFLLSNPIQIFPISSSRGRSKVHCKNFMQKWWKNKITTVHHDQSEVCSIKISETPIKTVPAGFTLFTFTGMEMEFLVGWFLKLLIWDKCFGLMKRN